MKHEVLKVSDLLPLTATTQRPVAFNTLTPAEVKQYLESANKFIDEWNAANPDGMKLRLKISRLNVVPNQNGRVAVIVGSDPNYNNNAFTYPLPVGNAIAQGLGLPSFPALASTIAATANDPSYVELTIKLVKKDEQYQRADGTMATYKCPGTAPIGREEIKLSAAAVRRIGNLTAEVDKQEMLAFRQGMTVAAAPVPAGNAGEHDDDLLGG